MALYRTDGVFGSGCTRSVATREGTLWVGFFGSSAVLSDNLLWPGTAPAAALAGTTLSSLRVSETLLQRASASGLLHA